MMTFGKNRAKSVQRRHISGVALMLIAMISVAGVLNTAPALAATSAEALVKKFGNQVIKILANDGPVRRQEKKFKSIFLRYADINTIGRFTLGKYARSINSSQRKRFNRLLSRFIVKVFISRMKGTESTGLKVLGTTELKKGRDYLVKSLVNVPNKAPVRVNWRIFRNRSGRLRLFDISIEGLWLAQEQRSIFVNIISRNNGKISALLDHLKQQIAKAN